MLILYNISITLTQNYTTPLLSLIFKFSNFIFKVCNSIIFSLEDPSNAIFIVSKAPQHQMSHQSLDINIHQMLIECETKGILLGLLIIVEIFAIFKFTVQHTHNAPCILFKVCNLIIFTWEDPSNDIFIALKTPWL